MEKNKSESIYEVKFDTLKLIEESRNRINADLHVSSRSYEIKTGELQEASKEDLKEGTAITVTKTEQQKIKADLYAQVSYDIVGEIEAITNLKRSTLVEILKSIKSDKFYMLRQNPEEFIAKTAKLINEAKASLIINNIAYHKTEESYDAKTVFTNDKSIIRTNEVLQKHIYDFLNTDSSIEKQFAKNLEQATEVIVYAKLPKSFYISTPVAHYSPDWAIVLDKEKVRHIYFVAETKGSDEVNQLREIEQLKIHCAQEHFRTISGSEVKFDVITNYSKLLDIAQLK